jgi:hypothetical protein
MKISTFAMVVIALHFVSVASAQDASARKAFAERVREEAAKKTGGSLPPGDDVSADGPDATLFMYHQHTVFEKIGFHAFCLHG